MAAAPTPIQITQVTVIIIPRVKEIIPTKFSNEVLQFTMATIYMLNMIYSTYNPLFFYLHII